MVNISDRKQSEPFLLCLQAQVERSPLMSNTARHISNVNVKCHYVALNTQKDKVRNVLWFCSRCTQSLTNSSSPLSRLNDWYFSWPPTVRHKNGTAKEGKQVCVKNRSWIKLSFFFLRSKYKLQYTMLLNKKNKTKKYILISNTK